MHGQAVELPPEAREPVRPTQPISLCNCPFASVHHSSVRPPLPLNSQVEKVSLFAGSSEGACDICFKSGNLERAEEVFL